MISRYVLIELCIRECAPADAVQGRLLRCNTPRQATKTPVAKEKDRCIVVRTHGHVFVKDNMANPHTKDIFDAQSAALRLVQDDEYYKYIFKKTEKIVSVVFYILYNTPNDSKTLGHIEDIQHTARRVHDAVIQSLATRKHAAEDAVREVALALVALESKMRVARTAGVIAEDVMNLLVNEIDTVLRGMNRYMHSENESAFSADDTVGIPLVSERPRRQVPRKERPEPQQEAPAGMDRRERIKTVLAARGTASIKDIAAVITDCSEKTIQRELNAMIEDNVIQRHGERRWSTYSIA